MVTVIKRSACCLAVALSLASAPAFADKTDDLSLLPVDSEMVGGLDFQQLQASQLWKQLVGPLMAKNDVQKEMAEFQQQCGLDPLKVVTKISFGFKGIGAATPDGVVVMHGVNKVKAVACYDKLVKSGKIGKDAKKDGDVLLFTKNGNQAAFTFVGDNTALFVMGAQGTKDGIKAVAKGGSALKTSAAFVELYKKTNTADTLWVIMNGSSKAFDAMASLGIKPKAVYGSLNVNKDLNLDMRVRMKNAADATNLSNMMNTQVKAAAGMVDKVTIAADGSDVSVKVLLSDAKLKALATQFGGMMGKP
ncbi:MAG: hypothetical protein H0V17_29420 [Deltaproteobacteria bacterium]|nr:hypothetical protein [Deltaproteobacteria bacterium]